MQYAVINVIKEICTHSEGWKVTYQLGWKNEEKSAKREGRKERAFQAKETGFIKGSRG